MARLSMVLRQTTAMTRNLFDHYYRAGHIRTPMPPSSQGKAMDLPLRAALEIGFIDVLAGIGTAGASASRVANEWLDELEAKKRLAPFVAIGPDGMPYEFEDRKTTVGQIETHYVMNEADTGYSDRPRYGNAYFHVINRQAVIDRMTVLFEED